MVKKVYTPRIEIRMPKKEYKELLALVTWYESTPEKIELPGHTADYLEELMGELLSPYIGEVAFTSFYKNRGKLYVELYVDESETGGEIEGLILPASPGHPPTRAPKPSKPTAAQVLLAAKRKALAKLTSEEVNLLGLEGLEEGDEE